MSQNLWTMWIIFISCMKKYSRWMLSLSNWWVANNRMKNFVVTSTFLTLVRNDWQLSFAGEKCMIVDLAVMNCNNFKTSFMQCFRNLQVMRAVMMTFTLMCMKSLQARMLTYLWKKARLLPHRQRMMMISMLWNR